jgi:hypothetical protein
MIHDGTQKYSKYHCGLKTPRYKLIMRGLLEHNTVIHSESFLYDKSIRQDPSQRPHYRLSVSYATPTTSSDTPVSPQVFLLPVTTYEKVQ